MYGTLLVSFIVIGWANLLERTNIKWYTAAIGCVLSPVVIQLVTFGIAALAEAATPFNSRIFLLPLAQLPFALVIFYALHQLEDTIIAWCGVIILGILMLFTIVPWLFLQIGIML